MSADAKTDGGRGRAGDNANVTHLGILHNSDRRPKAVYSNSPKNTAAAPIPVPMHIEVTSTFRP